MSISSIIANGLLGGSSGLVLGAFKLSLGFIDVEVETISAGAQSIKGDEQQTSFLHITMRLGKKEVKKTYQITQHTATIVTKNLRLAKSSLSKVTIIVSKLKRVASWISVKLRDK